MWAADNFFITSLWKENKKSQVENIFFHEIRESKIDFEDG